jgi:hypothetical protein
MPKSRIVYVSLLLVVLAACAKKEVMVPSYVYLKAPGLNTKADNSQGMASALVEDLYVFSNGETRGVMSVGSTIPLQNTGKTTVKIGAGIKLNGMAEQKAIYPMFNYYEQVLDLSAEKVDTIKTVFTYVENAIFPMIEDYETNGFELQYNPQYKLTGDTLVRDNSAAAWKPGTYSGRVMLNSPNAGTFMELYSNVYNNWPRFTPFFLEMDYKGNIPIIIGLYATDNQGVTKQFPIYVAYPKSGWNKLYFNLASEINLRDPNTQYRVFLRFSKESNVSNPEAWIDNLKVVYLD